MSRPLLLALVALAAGCASPAPGPDAPAMVAADAGSVLFSSDSCDEGGGYVVWNTRLGEVPPPFVVDDVSADVGYPPFTADGEPSGANLSGAYHAVVTCPTWTLDGVAKKDLALAFVAVRIVPPEFDPAPLEREYVGGVIAVNDPDLEAALVAAGLVPEKLLSAQLGFEGSVLRANMQFDHHGDIISTVPVKSAGAKTPETMRIWFLVPAEGGGMRPVALDVVDEGGARWIASAPGQFDHRAPSAAPPAPGMPLHEFSSWALAYRDVTRTVREGPTVDLVIDGDAHHQRLAGAEHR